MNLYILTQAHEEYDYRKTGIVVSTWRTGCLTTPETLYTHKINKIDQTGSFPLPCRYIQTVGRKKVEVQMRVSTGSANLSQFNWQTVIRLGPFVYTTLPSRPAAHKAVWIICSGTCRCHTVTDVGLQAAATMWAVKLQLHRFSSFSLPIAPNLTLLYFTSTCSITIVHFYMQINNFITLLSIFFCFSAFKVISGWYFTTYIIFHIIAHTIFCIIIII